MDCGLVQDQYSVQMWKQGNAKIVGVKTTAPAAAVNWYVIEIYNVLSLIVFYCMKAPYMVSDVYRIRTKPVITFYLLVLFPS